MMLCRGLGNVRRVKGDEFIVCFEGDYESLMEGAVDRFIGLDRILDEVRIRAKTSEDDLCS